MGRQVIEQPDGNYCVFSTIVDHFVLIDATEEAIIEEWKEEWGRQGVENITRVLAQLKAGEKPYYQFTQTFDEAVDWIKEVHGKFEISCNDGELILKEDHFY